LAKNGEVIRRRKQGGGQVGKGMVCKAYFTLQRKATLKKKKKNAKAS